MESGQVGRGEVVKTTLVLGLQGWGRRVYSDGGLGGVNGSNPVLYKKGCRAGVCLGLGINGVG